MGTLPNDSLTAKSQKRHRGIDPLPPPRLALGRSGGCWHLGFGRFRRCSVRPRWVWHSDCTALSRRQVGHCLATSARERVCSRRLPHQLVALAAGVLDALCVQRNPYALLRPRRVVDRVVAPIGAVVVPDVVVGFWRAAHRVEQESCCTVLCPNEVWNSRNQKCSCRAEPLNRQLCAGEREREDQSRTGWLDVQRDNATFASSDDIANPDGGRRSTAAIPRELLAID